MNDAEKTREQLIRELHTLRHQNLTLQAAATVSTPVEKARRESEARFWKLFECCSDAILLIDPERDEILSANANVCRLLGYSRDELRSQSITSMHADEMPGFMDFVQSVFASGNGWTDAFTCRTRNGRLLVAEISASVVQLEGKRCLMVLMRRPAETSLSQRGGPQEHQIAQRAAELQRVNAALQEEIAEHRRTEAALREAEERYRTLIEHANDPIVVLQHGKRVYQNRAHEKLLGYTLEETEGRSFLEVIAPEDRERVREMYQKRLRGEPMPEQYELGFLTRDGRQVPMEVRPCVIQYQGAPATLTVMRDITERKRIEHAIRESQAAAEAANRAKSEFLATVSHEIRTPMNGVIGMSELLLGTALTDEQREYAETICRSGEALLAIINDILDFSKIEAGKLDLETVDFELRPAVEDVLELLAGRAYDKGLELVCLIHPDVPMWVAGDFRRLQQVLLNLAGNAVKFTDTGEIVVRATLVEADSQEAVIRFSVSDTGIGIPSEVQSRLFHAFSQADGSTTRKYGGTGLGLAISKQLVELMGGAIGVESAPGQGSTFWFTIRLHKRSAPRPGTHANLPHHHPMRVLVVDDNATNRALLEAQLSAWGMHVTCVADGRHALERLWAAHHDWRPYDLTILDHQMPGMDGMAVARAIKADPALAAMRLILLTSVGQHEHKVEAQTLGFTAYLTKPIRQSHLYNCIVSVVHAPAESTPESSAPAGAQTHAHTRVLVVEDNPVNQRVAARMLEKHGCTVDLATNGREAVAASGRTAYDCIFMDCQMPEMDGFEATRVIRAGETQTGTHIPIIAMTANAMQGDRERCLAEGMDDYVSKPVKPEDLAAMLQKWAPSLLPLPPSGI